MIPDLPLYLIALAALAALLVGFSKTALPGLGIIVVPLMVLVWGQSKLSAGALLPMLIVGDLFAIRYYHRHADWKVLWGLVPWVLTGIVIGTLIGRLLNGKQHEVTIGVIVLAMTALEGYRRVRKLEKLPRTVYFAAFTGVFAGISTLLANAAGPIMGIYFLSIGFKKDEFMGTGAWYFLLLNTAKIPFYIFALGWITPATLVFDLCVAPLIVAGAFLGIWAQPKISQAAFSQAVFILAILGSAGIIYRGVVGKASKSAASTVGETVIQSDAPSSTVPVSTLHDAGTKLLLPAAAPASAPPTASPVPAAPP